MNLIVMPRNEIEIKNTLNYVTGYMIGLDTLSTNMPSYFNETEIFNILKKYNYKEFIITLNKNMHNSDIDYLKKIMLKLEDYNIKIAYYDIALVNIKKELKLKNPLVWNQEHLTNNYTTSNYWYEHGALYTIISSEITKREVNEIKTNAKGKIILPVFGYIPMFVSKRHLVKNYLETFKIKDNSNVFYMKNEDNLYPIIDDDETIAYSSKILNLIDQIIDIKADYYLLNSFLIEEEIFLDIVKMYHNLNIDNKDEYKRIIDLKLKTDTGFFNKETVYKVKS